jgi:hypothetical protein
MRYESIWPSAQLPVRIWHRPAQYVTPVSVLGNPYAGYYAERQGRFLIRSQRRNGVPFFDVPWVVFWSGNGLVEVDDLWL